MTRAMGSVRNPWTNDIFDYRGGGARVLVDINVISMRKPVHAGRAVPLFVRPGISGT